jgi:hypothetical protein
VTGVMGMISTFLMVIALIILQWIPCAVGMSYCDRYSGDLSSSINKTYFA